MPTYVDKGWGLFQCAYPCWICSKILKFSKKNLSYRFFFQCKLTMQHVVHVFHEKLKQERVKYICPPNFEKIFSPIYFN